MPIRMYPRLIPPEVPLDMFAVGSLKYESGSTDEDSAERGGEEDREVESDGVRSGAFCEAVEVSFTCGLAGCLEDVTKNSQRAMGKRKYRAYVDTGEVLRWKHVGRVRHQPHRRHLGPVEPVQLHLVVPPCRIHNDAPISIQGHLVVFRDQVGDGRARVLHLDPAVRGERVERHGAVVVELIGTVLPEDVGGDAGWVAGVRGEAVLSFLEEAGVGAGERSAKSRGCECARRDLQTIADTRCGGVSEGIVGRVAE